MARSRSFSVYLLKEGYNERNALKEGNNLLSDITVNNLPDNAKLFLLDSLPTEPWWKKYFDINHHLLQELKGAIVFLSVEQRNFAITFGHVSHNLKDSSYEYDFGLLVTLNCVDPLKLKSLDSLHPSSTLRQRSQLPVGSDLTFFDFDRDGSVLRSLTGNVKEKYKSLFKHATGSSNLRISSDINPAGLNGLCSKLLQIYNDNAYLAEFPDIQNIVPIKDPEKIDLLNTKLISAFKNKNERLILTIPEIINYKEDLCVTFSGVGKGLVYSDVSIEHYYEYLTNSDYDLNNINIETLKKHHLVLTNEDRFHWGERPSIFKCILFDVTIEEEAYHFCEGNWYLVNQDFLSKLSETIDPKCKDSTLLPYSHKDEGDYNEKNENLNLNRICLDKTSISLPKQYEVEPCDILEITENKIVMHHIKRNTLSASLSHLFYQGMNSLHFILDSYEAFDNLKKLIINKLPTSKDDVINLSIKDVKLKIVYGIITHKNKDEKSSNLPLFSRISLYRSIKTLNRMNIESELCFIKDETKIKAGKEKKRKK
ncbi:TIGR04141 family sporadically distributed protein [Legionella pneumophila serogroup 1]